MGTISSKFKKHLQNGDEFAAMQIYQSSSEIRKNLDPNSSYGDSHSHNTPLHYASMHAMKPLLRAFLYDRGGNPNKKNAQNQTSLHLACLSTTPKSPSSHERRKACVALILQWKGVQLNQRDGGNDSEVNESVDIAAADDKKNTALHYASANGLRRCTELLVAHGAPLFIENEDKDTPCDLAEKNGHRDIMIHLESKMVFNFPENFNDGDDEDVAYTEPYCGLTAQDLQEAKDMLLVETSDMLHIPLFTAEALLRNHEWSKEILLNTWIKDPMLCCEKARVQPPTSALQFKSQPSSVATSSTKTSPKSVKREDAKCKSLPSIITTAVVAKEYQCCQSLNSPVRTTSVEENVICDICTSTVLSTEEPVPVVCEHQFCRSCWKSYLEVKIQEGEAHNIMCPAFQCSRLVPVDVIENLVSADMIRRYLQFDIQAFVESNPQIKWCPFPGCGRAVRLPEIDTIDPQVFNIPNTTPPAETSHAVDCGNGHFFCWECSGDAHAPCNCEKWKEWHIKINEVKPEQLQTTGQETENAANCLWLVTNSKQCPNCKSPIQKNDGCNHMKCCKCKFDFCWVCLESWKKHNTATGGYFRCNRFEAVHKAEEKNDQLIMEAKMKNSEMQELNRFVHFYSRFKNHENSHKLEEPLLKTAKKKIQLLVATSIQYSQQRQQPQLNGVGIINSTMRPLSTQPMFCTCPRVNNYIQNLSSNVVPGPSNVNLYETTSGAASSNKVENEKEQEQSATGIYDTKFIDDAVKDLLKARRILCGSYVYGYYLVDNGYNKTIFEFMQNEVEKFTETLSEMVARPCLRTPKHQIICMTGMVKRKLQEFLSAVSKGLIPPETPPGLRKSKKRRFPGLMGIDPIEDVQITHAMQKSLNDLDPQNPWVKDSQGRHTNLAALCDWPDDDSDDEINSDSGEIEICKRISCNRPRVRNPRTGSMHEYCSLQCLKFDQSGEDDLLQNQFEFDYNMDLLIALEMSRLQMIEDMNKMKVPSSCNEQSTNIVSDELPVENPSQSSDSYGAKLLTLTTENEITSTCGDDSSSGVGNSLQKSASVSAVNNAEEACGFTSRDESGNESSEDSSAFRNKLIGSATNYKTKSPIKRANQSLSDDCQPLGRKDTPPGMITRSASDGQLESLRQSLSDCCHPVHLDDLITPSSGDEAESYPTHRILPVPVLLQELEISKDVDHRSMNFLMEEDSKTITKDPIFCTKVEDKTDEDSSL